MNIEVRNKRAKRAGVPRRALAVLVALCLVLGQMNSGIFVAYATSGTPVTIQVGTNVTAEISDGVLTLSGTGDTDDFTAETAPFKGYAPEIRALEIEEGVTYVGACLFYGLGELGGSLTLPGSIVGFGESAFSGEAPESSAHFSVIRNLFVSGEVVRPAQANPVLEEKGEPPLQSGAAAADLLRRPALHYADVAAMAGEGRDMTPFLCYCVEVELKYAGYIRRQKSQIEKTQRYEHTPIPPDFNYAALAGVSLEAREKLARIRPRSVGQASRIPGVSPADTACLAVALAKARGEAARAAACVRKEEEEV